MSSTERLLLRDLLVKEAMRAQVIALDHQDTFDSCIRRLIKYKITAVLVTSGDAPVGVVSKTDLMGAYYADLPIESPLASIMNSPPLFCFPNDSLESALNLMRSRSVYRLYVTEEACPEHVVGVLAYPDIVGQLYQYCRNCDRSLMNRKTTLADDALRYTVKEVMTPSVMSFVDSDSFSTIIEGLSAYRFGAVLIRNEHGAPVGVVSKTDLILAYRRGISTEVDAKSILAYNGVRCCNETDYIEVAIRKMIFSDIHRLFVYRDHPENIVGVFSLSDAARIRSGSCHACVGTRIKVESN